ncbi:MAG: ADP-ribosylglycohydrolase family protein, partial [Planctomycetota bacterium]
MIPLTLRRRIDRFQGCLAGIALGEAVGTLVDGWSPARIRARLGRVEGPDSRHEKEYLHFRIKRGDRPRRVAKSAGMFHPPGLYYALGQQALILSECLLQDPGGGGEAFARAFARFARPSRRGKFGLYRKPPPGFRASMGRFLAGDDWRTLGEETATASALPRVLPVGLAGRDDRDSLPVRVAASALLSDRTAF